MLEIKNLQIKYTQLPAVKNFSLLLNEGETVCIIGESGCGKTSILSAIMGILPPKTKVCGSIKYNGTNLMNISKQEYDKIRWNEISIVFQNSIKYLNPGLTVFEQISEVMKKDQNLNKKQKIEKLKQLFKQFDLDDKWLFAYPNSLSGGMVQRVLIIMALASEPKLLLIDEPTTALENIGREKLIKYLQKLKNEKNISIILVSHDLKLIEALAEKSIVMYKGTVFERNSTAKILFSSAHPYTRALVNASNDINPYKDLWGIKALDYTPHTGCAYYNYCTQRIEKCKTEEPSVLETDGVACHRGGIINLLKADRITKTFYLNKTPVSACKDCNLELKHGEILSIIGQSGSGKTTFAKILAGVLKYDSGNILFNSEEFNNAHNYMSVLNGIQIIFQDPFSAVNPLFTVQQTVLEPLKINSIYDEKKYDVLLDSIMQVVELKGVIDYNEQVKNLSGGQLQRVIIARALIMEPKVLIADEITAGLDISNKVNLLRLLKGLQNTKGFSMIFITHDLRMAQKISDSIAVMHNGQIVEQNVAHKIFDNPAHPYTKKLIATLQ